MIRPILKMGDPRLLRKAQPVTNFADPALQALIQDMFDTMHAVRGVGLAAPQIGVDLQLVIFGFGKNTRYPDAPAVPETVLINPQLAPLSEETEDGWEGCLSVPGLRGMVPRWKALHYEGRDPRGNVISRDVEGFHARVVQHECDHLEGILYPMRITDMTQFGYVDVLFPELEAQNEE